MQYSELKAALTNALRYELVDIESPFVASMAARTNELTEVITYLELLSQSAGSRFFSAENLANQTAVLAESSVLYHFVMSFYARVSIELMMACGSEDPIIELVDFVKRLHSGRYSSKSILSSDRVAMSTIGATELNMLLEGNAWFAFLYLAFMTGAYQDILNEYKVTTKGA